MANQRDIKKTVDKLIQEGGTKSDLFWKIRKRTINQKSSNQYDTIDKEGNLLEDPETAKEH